MVSHKTPKRLLLAFNDFLQGSWASLTVKNGDTFKGIFFGVTLDSPESAYLLKMVQQGKPNNSGDASGLQETTWDFTGTGEDHAKTFDIKDVIDLAVEGISLGTQNKMQNGKCLTAVFPS